MTNCGQVVLFNPFAHSFQPFHSLSLSLPLFPSPPHLLHPRFRFPFRFLLHLSLWFSLLFLPLPLPLLDAFCPPFVPLTLFLFTLLFLKYTFSKLISRTRLSPTIKKKKISQRTLICHRFSFFLFACDKLLRMEN